MVRPAGSTTASPISFRIRWEGDTCVLYVSGELDLSTEDLLRDAVGAVAESHRHALIDLTAVDFIDCRGLNAIVDALETTGDVGAGMRVRGLPPSAKRIVGALPVVGAALTGSNADTQPD